MAQTPALVACYSELYEEGRVELAYNSRLVKQLHSIETAKFQQYKYARRRPEIGLQHCAFGAGCKRLAILL